MIDTTANEGGAPLQLRLFGMFYAGWDNRPLPRLRSRKELWLLALLALHSPSPIDRVWLAGTLWPDSSESSSLANLRRSLSLLREALGPDAARLHSPTPGTLAIDLGGADVDILKFDVAVRDTTPAALQEAIAIYGGPLLEDCSEDWVAPERAAREVAFLDACERLSAICVAQDDLSASVWALRRALEIDPLRETVLRALMQTLASAGDASGAVQAFRRFRRRLRQELDAAPAASTRALYVQISRSLSPSGENVSSRLPHPLTELIGRTRELEEVVAHLDTTRLVTLMGTGGVGKTRLALAVASDVEQDCVDSVYFAALAALTSPDLLVSTLARALDISAPCETSEALIGYLREKHLLLTLDNCEHLMPDCSVLVGALLESCPSLRILATSRQPLGLPGETTYQVSPLRCPPPVNAAPSVVPETAYEAVQLFVARARQARPSFSADPRTLPTIGRICRRLDGLPLALELAAARVRSLSCEQIAQKLDTPFSLLAGGNKAALPRHQTLRAAIDWSFNLLTETERLMLGRLSVFAGGWSLEAAEVVGADGDILVLDALTALVENSLVLMEEDGEGAARYRMLETVREYGLEKLLETGAAHEVESRHATWFLDLTERAEPHLRGVDQAVWLALLELEHDNLNVALSWYDRHADTAELGLRLAAALMWFWFVQGHHAEGRQQLGRALASTETLAGKASATRAKALNGAGILASVQGDYAAARTCHDEALAIRRLTGEQDGIAASLNNLGRIALLQGDYAAARTLYAEGLDIFKKLGRQNSISVLLGNLGDAASAQGDYPAAQGWLEESLALRRQLDDKEGIASSLGLLGDLSYRTGDYAKAKILFEESLVIRRALGGVPGINVSLNNLARITLLEGDFETARLLYSESLSLLLQLGAKSDIADRLEGLAGAALGQNRPILSAQLLGAAAATRESLGSLLPSVEKDALNQRQAAVCEMLGADAFAKAWAEGQAMEWQQAAAFALHEPEDENCLSEPQELP